jgi:hypothetical protein
MWRTFLEQSKFERIWISFDSVWNLNLNQISPPPVILSPKSTRQRPTPPLPLLCMTASCCHHPPPPAARPAGCPPSMSHMPAPLLLFSVWHTHVGPRFSLFFSLCFHSKAATCLFCFPLDCATPAKENHATTCSATRRHHMSALPSESTTGDGGFGATLATVFLYRWVPPSAVFLFVSSTSHHLRAFTESQERPRVIVGHCSPLPARNITAQKPPSATP